MHIPVQNAEDVLLPAPPIITGKLLSPRKIMMDTRDRMEEVRKNIKKNGTFKDDGKTFCMIILLLKN